MVTSDFRPEVEIALSRMHSEKICNIILIIYYRNSSVVVHLLRDIYHVPQNVFLAINKSSRIANDL